MSEYSNRAMCVDVRGLPEEWEYAIEDYDMEKQG